MTTSPEPRPGNPMPVAALIAIGFILNALRENARELHQKLPEVYADSLASLLHPIDHPLTGLMAITPVLYGLAIYFLLMFFFLSNGQTGGIFNSSNLRNLRLAGMCIGIGVVTDALQPLIRHAVIPGIAWDRQNMMEIYLLIFVAGTLTTLSKNGNILFRHARKLRDDLDEIV